MTSDVAALQRELGEVVAELGDAVGLRSFQLPYPSAAQRVLDRVVLHCIGLGRVPPKGLPELLEWCRGELAGRLSEVPSGPALPHATLVHRTGLLPTRTCLELASSGADGGPEEAARVVLAELAGRCGSTDRFRRSRQFMALNPVVRREDRFRRSWSKEIWSRIKDLYRPVPESLTVEGTLLRCGTCRLPALLGGCRVPDGRSAVSGPETWCEGETCPHGVPLELIRTTDAVRLLDRPLRAFLSLPFRLEQAALTVLDRAGVGHEALPGELGAYRLQGAGLAVRRLYIRDRVRPAVLADRFGGATEPVAVVVPEELAGAAWYRSAFTRALPTPAQVLLAGPGDLVARLRDVRAFDRAETGGEGGAHSHTGPV